MWRSINNILFCLALFVVLAACNHKTKNRYTKHRLGYYFRILSFEQAKDTTALPYSVWIRASFSNQNDSVFWDSYNNMNDAFVLRTEPNDSSKFLNFHLLSCQPGDSLLLLIPAKAFYAQQFNLNKLPYFSQRDSVVKVHLKVMNFYSIDENQQRIKELRVAEDQMIRTYFGTEKAYSEAKDSSGFFWVQRPASVKIHHFGEMDELVIGYEGYFLNGRFLEKSPPDFTLRFGMPDQVLKGINFVIPYLNEGENVKIILPSPLAFGEQGSSNGTVPPFTPLLYTIKLNQVKRQ